MSVKQCQAIARTRWSFSVNLGMPLMFAVIWNEEVIVVVVGNADVDVSVGVWKKWC